MTPQQQDPPLDYNRIGIAVKAQVRLMYDDYDINWQDPIIRIAGISILVIPCISLVVFFICKYHTKKID